MYGWIDLFVSYRVETSFSVLSKICGAKQLKLRLSNNLCSHSGIRGARIHAWRGFSSYVFRSARLGQMLED